MGQKKLATSYPLIFLLFAKAVGHLNRSFSTLKVCDTTSFAGRAIAKILSIDFPFFISH